MPVAVPQDSVGSAQVGDPPARAWTGAALQGEIGSLIYRFSADSLDEIDRALAFVEANRLTLDTVEQEDVRIPSFARDVPDLRARLDRGRGFVILRGFDMQRHSEAQAEIVAWAIGNYLGRPIRQGLTGDRRLWSVADRGDENRDPTRIGATNQLSRMHSDNGCLEPRPPCYLLLFCVQQAAEGGESTLVAARTLHDTIAAERPDLLPLLFEHYHFRPPLQHLWPAGAKTISKPIFERDHGELRIHYARVMVEPGMELAGTPLSAEQRAALDYLDSLLERDGLFFRYRLAPGEMLVSNNLVTLHGRLAYRDDPAAGQRRLLKRMWLWRRHIGPGDDPVALDMAELQ